MEIKYCNPVKFTDGKRHTNPDPYILQWCGKYYCYATDEYGVKVSVSEDLVAWEYKGYALKEDEYRDYWAPSVLYENGIFYMYYSNVPTGVEDCHQEWLKLAVSADPISGFEWKKTFFNKFSIDSHPVLWNGEMYMFYSVNDWNGTEEKRSGTSILIDCMDDPENFAGEPKEAVLPGIPQEIYEKNRFGDGRDWYTIEGAAHVVRGRRFWLMYSANAYVNTDYFVGTAIARCEERLTDMIWKKYPSEYEWQPLLRKNAEVEGTGHNTVAKSPDMTEEWIVYHGRNAREELDPLREQREMRIDQLFFNGDELLCFGPGAEETPAPAMPAEIIRECEITDIELFGPGGSCYQAEMWISAEPFHTGCRWGFYLDYKDEKNKVEFEFHSGRQEITVEEVSGGIRRRIAGEKIRRSFDYTVPHVVQISKKFETYEIILDGREKIHCAAEKRSRAGKIGIRPYFTKLTLHSFSLTHTVFVEQKELKYLGRIYDMSPCRLGNMLCSESGSLTLAKDQPDGLQKEVFTFHILNRMNKVVFRRGSRTVLLAENRQKTFSVYHFMKDGKEYFLADGQWVRMEDTLPKEPEYRFEIDGLGITECQNAKK